MPSEYSPEELRAAREARERRSQVSDDMPEFLEEPLPQPGHRPGRSNAIKIASMAVSLLTLAGFAAIVSYAYLWGLGDVGEGKLPIVAAAAEPEKVRPEDPGGLQVPHQETLLLNEQGEGADTDVERLLPPPEQPTPPEPRAEAAAPSDAETAEGGATPAEVPQPPLEPTEPIQLTPERDMAAEPAEPAEPEAPASPADSPQTAETQATESTPAAPEPKPTADAPAQAEKPASSPSPAKTQVALKPGDYVIQMAAFRSEDRARQGWQSLQASHPEPLGDMNLLIQRVDIEGKGTFYRVQTGPFPNKTTAEDMCAQIKARGQACIVTRR